MSPRFVLGRENVPYVAEVVNRSLKADCTDSKVKPGDWAACAVPIDKRQVAREPGCLVGSLLPRLYF